MPNLHHFGNFTSTGTWQTHKPWESRRQKWQEKHNRKHQGLGNFNQFSYLKKVCSVLFFWKMFKWWKQGDSIKILGRLLEVPKFFQINSESWSIAWPMLFHWTRQSKTNSWQLIFHKNRIPGKFWSNISNMSHSCAQDVNNSDLASFSKNNNHKKHIKWCWCLFHTTGRWVCWHQGATSVPHASSWEGDLHCPKTLQMRMTLIVIPWVVPSQ